MFQDPSPGIPASPTAGATVGTRVRTKPPTFISIVLLLQMMVAFVLLQLAFNTLPPAVKALFSEPSLARCGEAVHVFFRLFLAGALLASSIFAFQGRLRPMRVLIPCQLLQCVDAASFAYAGFQGPHPFHWLIPFMIYSAVAIAVLLLLFAVILLVYLLFALTSPTTRPALERGNGDRHTP